MYVSQKKLNIKTSSGLPNKFYSKSNVQIQNAGLTKLSRIWKNSTDKQKSIKLWNKKKIFFSPRKVCPWKWSLSAIDFVLDIFILFYYYFFVFYILQSQLGYRINRFCLLTKRKTITVANLTNLFQFRYFLFRIRSVFTFVCNAKQ